MSVPLLNGSKVFLKLMTNFGRWLDKTVYIDLYTDSDCVYKIAQASNASLERPSWWKQLRKSSFDYDNMEPDTTMKSCSGANMLFAKRYPLLMPCDVYLKSGYSELSFYAHDENAVGIQNHPTKQHDNSFGDNTHIKFNLRWKIKTSPETHILVTGADMDTPQMTNTLSIVNGVLPPDVVSQLNINGFITRSDEGVRLNIPAGATLANLIPLTDRKVVYRHHLVSTDDYNQMDKEESALATNSYYRARKARSGCPFSKMKLGGN